MIFDPLMLAIESVDIDISNTSKERNIAILKNMYENQGSKFNGKKQSKAEIEERTEFFITVIREIISA